MLRRTTKTVRILYLFVLTGVVILLGGMMRGSFYKKIASVFATNPVLADIPSTGEGGSDSGEGSGEGGSDSGEGSGEGGDAGDTSDCSTESACDCGGATDAGGGTDAGGADSGGESGGGGGGSDAGG